MALPFLLFKNSDCCHFFQMIFPFFLLLFHAMMKNLSLVRSFLNKNIMLCYYQGTETYQIFITPALETMW
jgi:hypothetical protein